MFDNQLLKDKLCLQQQRQEIDEGQQQQNERQSINHEEADFTLDNYISKHDQLQEIDETQNKQSKDHDNQQQYQQDGEQDSSQLSILKNHILNIQSIAIKQIQGLKRQLEKQMSEKQALKQEIQKLKNEKKQVNSQFQNSVEINLLKQQNKMLKKALKKQLQINKNLIKNNIENKIIQTIENQTIIKDLNKENNPLVNNKIAQTLPDQYEKEKLKVLGLDRPSIPMPSQNKKPLRV